MKWVTESFHNEVQFGFPMKEELFAGKSDFQEVRVVNSPTHGKILLNDGCFMLSERDEAIYHEMMAHVPAFAHGSPKSALVIGGGDGGTIREIIRHSSIERAVLVEIDGMVVDACSRHIPKTASALKDPRVTVLIQDGIKFAHETKETFDLICVDSTDPVGFAQPLFGTEFYQDLRRILNPKGVIVSQAESPFYCEKMQSKLFRVLTEVFGTAHFYNFTNMTYPGGLWSFSFTGLDIDPTPKQLDDRIANSGLDFFYYNSAIHKAAFALPKFQMKNLEAK